MRLRNDNGRVESCPVMNAPCTQLSPQPYCQERLECVFAMMDDNSSGRVSKPELETLVLFISPKNVQRSEVPFCRKM